MTKKKYIGLTVTAVILLSVIISPSCNKPREMLYLFGTFPDTCINLSGINTQYDDYNMDLGIICNASSAIFSSNRNSQGGQFDLVTGLIEYSFDKYTGLFDIRSEMLSDLYLTALVTAANTEFDDLGPYRMLSREESYEYLFITTGGTGGDMDIKYMRYLPDLSTVIPDFGSLQPMNVINSSDDDGYISFDVAQERLFFHSDREGVFNIFTTQKPQGVSHYEWFAGSAATVARIDSINSEYDDKCPLVIRNLMVFTSNRPGGLGGYDLYYSIYKDGKWGSPINFGPTVNSESDEYRPVVGYHPDFSNYFLIFSSDRPGGVGGFDIWFAGIEIPGQPAIIMK